MKFYLLSLIGAAALVLWLEHEGEYRANGALDLGSPLPRASAIAVAPPHTTVNVADLVDRPTVIDIWQSWCQPCKQSLLPLERFADSVGSDRLRVVYLTMNAVDDTARITQFLAEAGVHHPPPVYSILDSDAKDRFLMHGAPFVMVVDRAGRLRWREHGPMVTPTGTPEPYSKVMDTLRAVLAMDGGAGSR